jgi:hypothetical protein
VPGSPATTRTAAPSSRSSEGLTCSLSVLLLTARGGIDDRVRGWTPAHRQAWRGRTELELSPRSSRCWSCRVPAPQGRPALRGRTWRRCAGPATGCGARRSLDADPAAPDPGRGGVTIVLAGLLSPRVLRASLVAAIDEHLVKRSDAGCDWPSRSSWWHSAWRSASPGSPARTDAATGQEGRDDVALTGDRGRPGQGRRPGRRARGHRAPGRARDQRRRHARQRLRGRDDPTRRHPCLSVCRPPRAAPPGRQPPGQERRAGPKRPPPATSPFPR